MSLPNEPGLQRRLAYGDLVRRRNRRRGRTEVGQLSYSEYFDNVIHNYERFISLPTVKVGATLTDIIENTHLHICYEKLMCDICQDDTSPLFGIVRSLGCKHTFHAKCIDKWLVDNHKCPLCNKSVRSLT